MSDALPLFCASLSLAMRGGLRDTHNALKGADVLRQREAAEGAPYGVDEAERLPRLHHLVPARGARRVELQAEEGEEEVILFALVVVVGGGCWRWLFVVVLMKLVVVFLLLSLLLLPLLSCSLSVSF